MDDEKLRLIQEYQEEVIRQRGRLLKVFIPDKPSAEPFPEQIAFLSDKSNSKLARCGNRAAKTFTTMRDLAWKITRTHWYRQDWNVLKISDKAWKDKLETPEYEKKYLKAKPRTFWVVGPTYEFVKETMWGMYLEQMIPAWFIKEIKLTNQKNIEAVHFINGDVLKCKTYAQQDSTKMGFAVDEVYIDEAPPEKKTITELIVRTFDKDGSITLGFTPIVQNKEIQAYLDSCCSDGTMSLHSWSVLANPHYRDHPERRERVLAEYSHMSEEERNTRLSGAWYIERPNQPVFEGLEPEIVDDFPVPDHWRQIRYTDPASHVTGHAIFAEDPATGEWYTIHAQEITWGKIAKAEDILDVIEALKPTRYFKYYDSVYDNAEAWFGAYGRQYGYRPCIVKNREAAIMQTRNAVGTKRLKFFRRAAAGAVEQFKEYHYKPDGQGVVKKKDHMLDCVMYFCREIPDPLPTAENQPTVKEEAVQNLIRKYEAGPMSTRKQWAFNRAARNSRFQQIGRLRSMR